jgi:hypothetical protein
MCLWRWWCLRGCANTSSLLLFPFPAPSCLSTTWFFRLLCYKVTLCSYRITCKHTLPQLFKKNTYSNIIYSPSNYFRDVKFQTCYKPVTSSSWLPVNYPTFSHKLRINKASVRTAGLWAETQT